MQSLRQCPVCGNPYSLSIVIKVDKETDRKSAEVYCTACGFRYEFAEIPVIADEFWVYSKILDIIQGRAEKITAPPIVEKKTTTTGVEELGETTPLEGVEAEIIEEVEEENLEEVDKEVEASEEGEV